MKSFIHKSVFFLFCTILAITAFICLMPKSKGTSYIIYNEKIKLLEETPSPKMVFVSGSSLYTSLDSKRVSDSLHLPVVNYGFHAGIGLRYMIDDVAQYAKKGDIFVISPEYPQFFSDIMYGNPETLAPLMYFTGFRNLTHMNGKQFMNVIAGLPYIIKVNFVDGFMRNEMKGKDVPLTNFMNEYGDETTHWGFKGKIPLKSSKIKEDEKILDTEFATWFIERIQQMENQGALVLLVPSVIRYSGYVQEEERTRIISDFLKSMGHPYHSEPIKHALPDSCAWNSDYHMNYYGVVQNTDRLISELKDFIQEQH